MVHGRLSGKGDIVVDGRLDGDVALEGSVTVGPSGIVVASVQAGTVVVDGVLKGNVHAASAVAVRAGGRIEGDVRAPRVAIDDGGTLHGGIEMEFDLPEEAQ
jgi:cytoskeletal protein CcmA (bactofilin family)